MLNAEYDSRTSRLVVVKIVMENFKSYCGVQELGPFHKSFTSIVGPNGSGKSNIIDALMFVLGFRAKKMRQSKLSDLIHVSKDNLNIESCSVHIHFSQVYIDKDDEIVPGSQFVVSRTAYSNNRSTYAINMNTCSISDVTTLLKGHGVDLDHKRFLILQGEVELISQMKPKGSNEHEEGLLEYFEDIIGTNVYIKQIEETSTLLDQVNERYAEKIVRVRASEKEMHALSAEKTLAENFLRQENSLILRKSELLQVNILQASQKVSSCKDALEKNISKLASEREKNATDAEEMERMEKDLRIKMAEIKVHEQAVKDLKSKLSEIEKHDIKLQEGRKHLKARLKAATKSNTDLTKNKNELDCNIENAQADMKLVEEELASLKAAFEHNDMELSKIAESLKDVTLKFQSELESKQAKLNPLLDTLRKEQQALQLEEAKLADLEASVKSRRAEHTSLVARQSALKEEWSSADVKQKQLIIQLANLEGEIESIRNEIATVTSRKTAAEREISVMQSTVAEAKETLQEQTHGNAIIASLQRECKSGRIKGVHGRLGDLGSIDEKYDTAISTACSYLDHIVVDTMEAGQQCIEHLRKSNLGRASFIILAKMRPFSKKTNALPGTRLFEMVTPKDSKFIDAFYFALGDTLVAQNIDEATKLAFSNNQRHRVVSLDGKLIETSGTMSGGGRVIRGGMKGHSKPTKDNPIISPEQLDQLMMVLTERQAELKSWDRRITEMQASLSEKLSEKSAVEAALLKVKAILDILPEQMEMSQTIHTLENDTKVESQIHQIKTVIAKHQEAVKGIQARMEPVQKAIDEVQKKILDAGGIRYRSQKAKLDGIKDQIDTLQTKKRRLETDFREWTKKIRLLESQSAGHDIPQIEAEIGEIDQKIDQNTREAMQIQQEHSRMEELWASAEEDISNLKHDISKLNESLLKFRKIEYELKSRIEKDQEDFEHHSKIIESAQTDLSKLTLHQFDDEPAVHIAIYEGDDLNDLVRRVDKIKAAIGTLQGRLETERPNLKVLQEYRNKKEAYDQQHQELKAIEEERDRLREQFETLRKRRFDEFFLGFLMISQKLKEIYQLLTMGGNAELELVDSLDPFSEGILYSVMPPRKSWKNISNLSGGEKTLSSLALVFALHAYKPTPIYVMDEIDAALDFRNVSIVATYIRERTKDAQFIVISLRNNMFELADRLVGIYKCHQRTRSVTVDPKKLEAYLPSYSKAC